MVQGLLEFLLLLLVLLLLVEGIVGEPLKVQVLCRRDLIGEGMDLVGIAGYEVGWVVGDSKGRVGVLVKAVRPALLHQKLRRRRWVGVLSK